MLKKKSYNTFTSWKKFQPFFPKENRLTKSNLPKEEKCVTDSDCASEEVCTSGMCIKEEASGSSAWLIILIILIVLGGGGAFFYLYFVKSGKFKFKGKSSGSSFDSYKMTRPLPSGPVIPPVKKPVQTVMPRPVFSAPKKVQDDELEKSLKRAEELLFKK